MRVLRLLVLLSLTGFGLTLLFFVFLSAFSSDIFSRFDSKQGQNDQNTTENDVEGITINSLSQTNSSDELLIYLNGVSDPIVANYKLSTGRQKTIAELSGADINYYSPGKVTIDGNYIYWIKQNGPDFSIIKISTGGLLKKEEKIYTKKGIDQLFGVVVLENKDIFFTEYTKVAGSGDQVDVYNYSIIRLRGGKAQEIYKASGQLPKMIVGVDDKDKSVLRNYDENINKPTGTCNLLENLKEIGCEGLKGTEYLLTSYEPTSKGYQMELAGYIDITDKKGKKKTILKGEIDEHFESLQYKDGFVYFIAGKVEKDYTSSEVEGIKFGSFVPISLERIKIDGTERQVVKHLPATLFTQIEYVGNEYAILSISQSSSNKYDIKPANLWVLDLESLDKSLDQLTDIDCDTDEFCEAVFLQIN